MIRTRGAPQGGTAIVRRVKDVITGRSYAMKAMLKDAVAATRAHVYSEQAITRSLQHPFCLRQYASFQDQHYLFFLFDLIDGCAAQNP